MEAPSLASENELLTTSDRPPALGRRPWSARDTLALVAVVLLAGALRFWTIDTPGRLLFDENFYARDACLFVDTPDVCGQDIPQSREHPLGAKWLIAAGIEAFGYEPFGWRFPAAVAGTLGVAIVFLLGRRILGSTCTAAAAGSLLAVDFLHLAFSRLATLDVFVTTFGSAAVLFAVIDRDRRAPAVPEPRRERLRDRPWLLAAGAALGAAIASKWSGGLFVPAVAAAVISWDSTRRSASRRLPAIRATIRRQWIVLAVAFVAIPLVIYVVSFGDRLDGALLAAPWDRDSWWWDLARRQVAMVRDHLSIDAEHGYASPAWSWPLVKRPVNIAWDDGRGVTSQILGFGSPFVWWPAVLAVLWAAIRWFRGRRGHANPEGVILLGVVGSYVPWLALTNVRSFTFIFYLLPAVPFVCLAVAWALRSIAASAVGRAFAAAYLAIVLAAFVFFLPVLTARPLPDDAWLDRIWFRACPDALNEGGLPRPSFEPYAPPDGWCWI